MTRTYAVTLGLVLGLATLLGGCGTATTPPAPVPTSQSSTGSSPAPVTAEGSGVAIGPAANGTTVHVDVGSVLVVTLDNTYWRFGSPTGVLKATAPETVTPAAPGNLPTRRRMRHRAARRDRRDRREWRHHRVPDDLR